MTFNYEFFLDRLRSSTPINLSYLPHTPITRPVLEAALVALGAEHANFVSNTRFIQETYGAVCIQGALLRKVGVELPQRRCVVGAFASVAEVLELSAPEELEALHVAQAMNDMNYTWGECVERALRVLSGEIPLNEGLLHLRMHPVAVEWAAVADVKPLQVA